jgi:hypothetical protein
MCDCSKGPVSTLPGSHHPLPVGTMCDGYNCECEKLAVSRIQGETDSFSAEYNDYCQSCLAKMKAEEEAYRLVPKTCDWCKKQSVSCAPVRDLYEGTDGPVYDVCPACRQKQNQRADEELESYRKYDNYEYDD